MASSAHGTLVADEVTTVTIETDHRGFAVVNRSLEGEIWVRFDGEDPEEEGDDSYVCLGVRHFPGVKGAALEISLLSTAALKFSVEAAP